MKKVIGIFAVLLVLVLGAIVVVPMLLPLDTLVKQAQRQVLEMTGRDLRLESPSVSVFPNLVVTLNNVALASPPPFDSDLVNIGSVDIDINWSSIWQGEVSVDRFTLTDWTLNLITNAEGGVNWQMGSASPASSGGGKINIPSEFDVQLSNVALGNGLVIITNAVNDSIARIEDINVELNMPSLSKDLNVKGQLTMLQEQLTADMTLDNLRGFLAGEASQLSLLFEGYQNRIDFNGQVMNVGQRVTGKLVLDDLDLVPLLQGGTESSVASETAATTEPASWSEQPIDLSGLIGPDIDIQVSMNSLATPWLNTNALDGIVSLKNGQLVADIKHFSAYQGKGSGVFRIDAKGASTRSNFDFMGVQIQPLLEDVVEVNKLLGSGDVNFAIEGNLQSVSSLMQTLEGKASLSLNDGAVVGFNLAAILKSAKNALQGNFSNVSLDQSFAAAEKTDFSSMSASFVINQGIMVSKDTQLLSPLLRVTGEGSIDMSGQALDYVVNSRLVASTEGQGADVDESGITIPIAINGPWSDISVAPKLSSALKDKSKAKVEEVKQEGKQKIDKEIDRFLDKNLKDDTKKNLLKDLFSR